MSALSRRLAAEFLGAGFLLATVVGSGILCERLAAGNVAIVVLGVALATGCVLSGLILTLGGISAQFNPAVTLVEAIHRRLPWSQVPIYLLTQVAGATAGVAIANLMFEGPAVAISQSVRSGGGQWLGEVVATFGLLLTIQGCSQSRPQAVPFAVSAYVAGAILFTSSTCFANPAVTISRMFTSTITGIRPSDVPAFIVAQLAGVILAVALCGWLFKTERESPLVRSRGNRSGEAPETRAEPVASGR